MTAPQPPDRKHLVADALHRLADLYAADRVEECVRYLQVKATDEGVVADLTAGMNWVEESPDPDTGATVWCGWLLGQFVYVRLVEDVPSLAQVASAAPTPDAMQPTDPAWWDVDQPRVWRWENEADRVRPEGVTDVVDDVRGGQEWKRRDDGQWIYQGDLAGVLPRAWGELLYENGPLREVVPAPAPRVWEQDSGGPEPDGVNEVIDRDGDHWRRSWWQGRYEWHPAKDLSADGIKWGSLTAYGPLTEVLPGGES